MRGTPIQKSPDQSLLSGSPKLIAANHVLHRFQLPRCPPFALTALTRHTLYSLVKDQRSQLRCAEVNTNIVPRRLSRHCQWTTRETLLKVERAVKGFSKTP